MFVSVQRMWHENMKGIDYAAVCNQLNVNLAYQKLKQIKNKEEFQ